MSKDIKNTPDKWIPGAVMLTPEIGYEINGKDVTFWHWCTAVAYGPRWMGRGTGHHQILSLSPLHLEPSLLCGEEGCSMHGFIRDGKWENA